MATKKTPQILERVPTSLPSGAHALAAIGPSTEEVVNTHFASSNDLFNTVDQAELKKLASALEKDRGWTDEEASQVVARYAEDIRAGRGPDVSSVARWALAHPNNSAAVFDCMSVKPPDKFSIIRVLSTAGSQKMVFLASWQLALRQVVLKRVTGPTKDSIIERETQVHPLSMRNRNIVETHVFQNEERERFLVEERLPMVLDDKWRSHGIHEAANLLHDIGNALTFLHEKEFVHGDIKPDNIGKKSDDYILLDFGICRAASKFTPETTGTGSLRTRAPELITNEHYSQPKLTDVWALAATVFNTLVGRFPLFNKDESPPRVSHPTERAEFESLLKNRILNEWDKFIDLSEVPEPVRKILQSALSKDANNRCSAKALTEMVEKELSGFLRTYSHGRFSALDEVEQLVCYLPSGPALKAMPIAEKEALQSRLAELKEAHGLPDKDVARVSQLIASFA